MAELKAAAIRFDGNKKLYFFTTKEDTFTKGDKVLVKLKNGKLETVTFIKYAKLNEQAPPACTIIGHA